jgi:hypothetical protein
MITFETIAIQEKETLYNNENINPTLIWELIKSDIRGYAIKYSSEVKKQETEVIKPSPTEIRKESNLHCILGYFCLHEYLFSIGLRILQMSIKSFLSMYKR